MQMTRPVRHRLSTSQLAALGLGAAGIDVVQLVARRRASHRQDPVVGALVCDAGDRETALALEAWTASRGAWPVVVADVTGEPADLLEPGLHVADLGAGVTRSQDDDDRLRPGLTRLRRLRRTLRGRLVGVGRAVGVGGCAVGVVVVGEGVDVGDIDGVEVSGGATRRGASLSAGPQAAVPRANAPRL